LTKQVAIVSVQQACGLSGYAVLFICIKALILKRPALLVLTHVTQHGLWLLLLLSSAALFQLWLLVALRLQFFTGVMALLVAIAISAVLRQGLLTNRHARAGLAVGLTALLAVTTYWCSAAALLSMELGMPLWESALRLGPQFAWTLIGLNNNVANGLWLIWALLLAGWLAGKA